MHDCFAGIFRDRDVSPPVVPYLDLNARAQAVGRACTTPLGANFVSAGSSICTTQACTQTPNCGCQLQAYDVRLWGDYNYTFGKNDTVGFSFGVDDSTTIDHYFEGAYGSQWGPPYLFDIHIYGDAYNKFNTARSKAVLWGYGNTGWIIGEAFYNDSDSTEANDLYNAMQANPAQTVFYLAQWPLSPAKTCPLVDTAQPLLYNYYSGKQF
ncbi:MAG TPA: hypothetical protein VJN43_13670 [Bryobacteraceae bacterium]|nr:hypothetical protein [Bryobacteraceae bacterium]